MVCNIIFFICGDLYEIYIASTSRRAHTAKRKAVGGVVLGWIFSCATHVLEDGGNTRKPVNTGIDNQTQFVYQPFDKQCAIENTATLYRYATDAELTTDSSSPSRRLVASLTIRYEMCISRRWARYSSVTFRPHDD